MSGLTAGDRYADPEFTVAMRGYDRGQVDTYTRDLRQWLEDELERSRIAEEKAARARAEAAELRRQIAEAERPALTADSSLAEVGAEAAHLLKQASELADSIRQRAQEQAGRLVADAEARAADMVVAAQQQASGLEEAADRVLAEAHTVRQDADQQARRMIDAAVVTARADADRLRVELNDELEYLRRAHRRLLGQLTDLHAELGSIVSGTEPDSDRELAPAVIDLGPQSRPVQVGTGSGGATRLG